MPTLFKRSNGIFYAILTDATGKRKWISTGKRLKREAFAMLKDLSGSSERRVEKRSLREFSKEFLEYTAQVSSPGNTDILSRSLKHFVEIVCDVPLTSVNARHVDAFKGRRIQEVKPVTVNIELRSLKAAFQTAVRWEYIGVNPFKSVRMCEIDEHTPSFLTLQQFQRLLEGVGESWLKDIVIVAALTGMRRGELINLRWSAVDFDQSIIRIESHGEFRTKRGKRRSVPMSSQVVVILKSRLREPVGDYVFHMDGKQISPNVLSMTFKRRVRKAGLDARIHFHSLRHTFATWLVQENASLYEVQKLLGHSNIRVTEVYSHILPETLHHTVSKIPFQLNADAQGFVNYNRVSHPAAESARE